MFHLRCAKQSYCLFGFRYWHDVFSVNMLLFCRFLEQRRILLIQMC
uniref:Uncharacterized protein n=1 Tax=Arundo donax TaxID=35708 RepID=A0A0A9A4C8_ARUDO